MQSSELGDEQTTTGGATSSDEQAAAEAGPADCQTGPSVARFQATVAFDAVPVPDRRAAGRDRARDAAPEATTGDHDRDDHRGPRIAAAQVQGEAAIDSANEQVSRPRKAPRPRGCGE